MNIPLPTLILFKGAFHKHLILNNKTLKTLNILSSLPYLNFKQIVIYNCNESIIYMNIYFNFDDYYP